MKGKVRVIDYKTAVDFLLPRHYSGRTPQITRAFGWYFGQELKAVLTFGKPASHNLCTGICGIEHAPDVYELNRLCREPDLDQQLSQFVGACLRRVKANNWIIVSYADTDMHHTGYIYQACNFLYTGKTRSRTDRYTPGNKHSRHYTDDDQHLRKVRSAKHRYVYFATRDKWLKQLWTTALNYKPQEYPKEQNQNYTPGEYQVPKIINKKHLTE